MGKRIFHILAVLLASGLGSCRDSFEPEVTAQDIAILVVERYIETNREESAIYLSKANLIRSESNAQPVTDAIVFLQSETGGYW